MGNCTTNFTFSLEQNVREVIIPLTTSVSHSQPEYFQFYSLSNIFLQTSASNSLSITEEYISTFKPSGYARTFGRALNNQQCGGAHLCCPGTIYYAPPQHPFSCPFSKADFWTGYLNIGVVYQQCAVSTSKAQPEPQYRGLALGWRGRSYPSRDNGWEHHHWDWVWDKTTRHLPIGKQRDRHYRCVFIHSSDWCGNWKHWVRSFLNQSLPSLKQITNIKLWRKTLLVWRQRWQRQLLAERCFWWCHLILCWVCMILSYRATLSSILYQMIHFMWDVSNLLMTLLLSLRLKLKTFQVWI